MMWVLAKRELAPSNSIANNILFMRPLLLFLKTHGRPGWCTSFIGS
jgi:hypothetical protein